MASSKTLTIIAIVINLILLIRNDLVQSIKVNFTSNSSAPPSELQATKTTKDQDGQYMNYQSLRASRNSKSLYQEAIEFAEQETMADEQQKFLGTSSKFVFTAAPLTLVQAPPNANQLVSDEADVRLDVRDQLKLQVPLQSKQDNLYLGQVYLGTPQSQPVKVAFDTGSEYLAITSSLCSGSGAPPALDDVEYKHHQSGQQSGVTEAKKHGSNVLSQKQSKAKDLGSAHSESRCLNEAYDIQKSKSAVRKSDKAMKVSYGSAELHGYIYEEQTCLQPLADAEEDLKQSLKASKCTKFQVLALNEAKGLGKDFNGILGLSPRKNEDQREQHLLWSLKEHGLITRAMVSFSLTQNDMKDSPYALFGGYNSTQIVHGAKGLKTFKTHPNGWHTWGLLGQGMTYNRQYFANTPYPAILDTGDSQLSVPPPVFDLLAAQWKQDIPNLECKSNATFCHVHEACESVVKKVKPVAFQLSDYMFEITPEEYLFKARKNTCFFVIHKTEGTGEHANMYLAGILFLRHFYSVYDFDHDEISLGVNTHSLGRVHMYAPGDHPRDEGNSLVQGDQDRHINSLEDYANFLSQSKQKKNSAAFDVMEFMKEKFGVNWIR